MKQATITLLTLLGLLICLGATSNEASPSNHTLIIKHARLIIGNGKVLPSATVVIKDGRIQKVSTQDLTISDAQVIDAAGKSLMPGLIDTHLHLFYSSDKGEQAYRALLENQAPKQMQNFLRYGVTTIKSINDPLDIVLTLRQQLQDKKIPGPQLLTVGPAFTAPDGHPAIALAYDPWFRKEMAIEVATPDEARAAVRKLAAQRVDAIKLIYQGGEMETLTHQTLTIQKLSKAVMRAIIAEAHQQQLRATVHVWYEQDAIDALEAGADGLEHGLVGVSLTDQRLVDLLKEKQAFYVPTLQVMKTSANQELLPIAMRNLKAMADQGVLIALGTDMNCAFQTGGLAEIEEMELMQQAGMTPNQIITAATRNAAEHLGQLKERGTIETGKIADLILVDGDPTQDISAVRKIRYVFQAGTIVFDAQKTPSTANDQAANGQNMVSWFEIPVSDIDRAKAFYEKVFAIKLSSMDFGYVKIANFPDHGNATGASGSLMQNPNNQPTGQGTVVYFTVEEMDTVISRIQAAGGKILQPKFNMGQLGYIALFQDSEGNTIGLRSAQ